MAEKSLADHEPEHKKRQPAPEPAEFGQPMETFAAVDTYLHSLPRAAGGPVGALPRMLHDRRLPLAQRQDIAAGLGHVHGNRHLSRMIAWRTGALIQRNGPPGAAAPAAGGTAPVGVIPSAQALQARAQEILKNTYGFIKPIVPTPVQVVDEATLRTKFDEMQVRKGTNNARTGEPWKMGDSLLVFRTLDGFADRDNNTIYVPDSPAGGATSQLPTIVHEMLHTNAAGDWASTAGGAIDEGQTELLTMKACTAQRVSMTPTYASQRGLVGQLIPVVGEDTLQRAYFGGGSILVNAFDAVRGEGKWAQLKKAMGEGDREKVDRILTAPRESDWAKEKIRIIREIIHSWWVTDADVARIEAICSTANPDDLRAIANAIGPEATSLSDFGQRARVRMALGM